MEYGLRPLVPLYFDPYHAPWYEGQVWGNVFAVLPLAVLGTIGYWLHKLLTKEIEEFDHAASHAALHAKVDKLLLQLDPDAESDGTLDRIYDKVNEETPGGIGTVLDEVRKLVVDRERGNSLHGESD